MTPPPHSVMLLYGTGSKAQHNGKSAQLGKRSGSWTTATIHGGKSVKWRNGHWQDAEEEDDEAAAALDFALDAEEDRLKQQSQAEIQRLDMQMAEAEPKPKRQERDRADAVAQQQHEEAQQARALEEAQMQVAHIVASVHAAPPTAVAQHDGVHRSPFALLPDALIVEMLRGLTTPDVCHVLQATRTLSALSQYAPFGECHLRDGVAARWRAAEQAAPICEATWRGASVALLDAH